METFSIAVFITLAFAAANLLVQLAAIEGTRRERRDQAEDVFRALEHPYHTRIDGMPRTRTDRHDLQLGMGHDFAAPDVADAVWPRDPRI